MRLRFISATIIHLYLFHKRPSLLQYRSSYISVVHRCLFQRRASLLDTQLLLTQPPGRSLVASLAPLLDDDLKVKKSSCSRSGRRDRATRIRSIQYENDKRKLCLAPPRPSPRGEGADSLGQRVPIPLGEGADSLG